MRVAGITELKARLSEYLAVVQAGEEVLVTDRDRPIARIVGVAGATGGLEESGRLDRLVREGLARPPSGELPADFWGRDRPIDSEALVRQALIAERREGR